MSGRIYDLPLPLPRKRPVRKSPPRTRYPRPMTHTTTISAIVAGWMVDLAGLDAGPATAPRSDVCVLRLWFVDVGLAPDAEPDAPGSAFPETRGTCSFVG